MGGSERSWEGKGLEKEMNVLERLPPSPPSPPNPAPHPFPPGGGFRLFRVVYRTGYILV